MKAAATNATPRLKKLPGRESGAPFFFLASWVAIGLSTAVDEGLAEVDVAVGPAVEVSFWKRTCAEFSKIG